MSLHSLPSIEIDGRLPAAVRLAACLACVAGAAVPLSVLPVAGQAATVLLAAGLALGFRRAGWLGGPRALRRAVLSADGRWWLEDGQGTCSAELLPDTRVFSRWLWLSWSSPAGRRRALVPRSGADASATRRLATRLRLTGLAPASSRYVRQHVRL